MPPKTDHGEHPPTIVKMEDMLLCISNVLMVAESCSLHMPSTFILLSLLRRPGEAAADWR